MRIKIRLKGIQDIDLLALKQNPSFYFERAMKTALVSHVRGEKIEIGSPPPSLIPIPEIASVYITLNDEKESDVISWYQGIKDGCKSTAIKAIFRCALSRAYVDVLSDVHIEEKREKPSQSPKKNKKVEKKESKEKAPVKSGDSSMEPLKNSEKEPLPESDNFDINDFVEIY